MIKPTLEHHIWIAAPRERAWDAITQTEHIKQWWGADGYAEINRLTPDAAIKFGTGDGPILLRSALSIRRTSLSMNGRRIRDTSLSHSSRDTYWMKKMAILE